MGYAILKNEFFITAENIEKYIAYLKDEERATATIEKYIRDIRAFAVFLNGAEVTKQAASQWKDALLQTRAPVTVNAMIIGINGFFEFFELGIKVKPLKIHRSTFLSEEKELTIAEYNRLLEAAKTRNERIYCIMQTICSTGIRVSELKFITAEATMNGQAEIRNKGKIRVIFIPHDLKNLLLQYMQNHKIDSGIIFKTKTGAPLDRSNIWTAMKNLCAAAGVDGSKVFPHNLRRLFARTFYAKERDIIKLSDILGHSDCKTTRIYIMDTGCEHRRIVNSLGLVAPVCDDCS